MFSLFVIKGQSMSPFGGSPAGREPLIREGDFVLVNKMSYLFSRPKVGQLIVLKDPEDSSRRILKRITAVKDSFLWVEGDNKEKSTDSRHFGWVGKECIIGNAHIVGKPRTRAKLGAGLRSPRQIWLA